MRDGTGHNKFIFKIPYYFYFLSFNFFLREKIIFSRPKNEGVGVIFYSISLLNEKETYQI